MFPFLLDDQSLVTEFELFVEAVDNMHELTLAGHQQFPVFCCQVVPKSHVLTDMAHVLIIIIIIF